MILTVRRGEIGNPIPIEIRDDNRRWRLTDSDGARGSERAETIAKKQGDGIIALIDYGQVGVEVAV